MVVKEFSFNWFFTYLRDGYSLGAVKRIICKNGFSMSVQAGKWAYSHPRNDTGPWISFEIGFPNKVIPEIMDYAEEPGDPTETVYAYVPVKLIEGIIEENGGINYRKYLDLLDAPTVAKLRLKGKI